VQIAFVVEGLAGHLHQAGPDPISHVGRRPGAQQPGESGVDGADAEYLRLLPGPGPRGRGVLRPARGQCAVPGRGGDDRAARLARAGAVHRGQRGGGDQQHSGRRRLGAAGWAAGSPRGRGGVDGRGPPCWCLDCISGTSSSGSRTSDAGPRRVRRRAQGSPIVSRTGPAPSRRPGGVGPLLAQAAVGRTGRTPHSPTRPDIRSGASDLDETHGSLRRPRRAREPPAR
jgi:hypothetical protein